LTNPISDVEVRGWAPNTFISRAGSHVVGGEGGGSEEEEGDDMSHVKGEVGAGDGLSFMVIKVM